MDDRAVDDIGVADRLLTILIAMLKSGQPYDPKRREASATSADAA
jgi:hypothetical protein